MKKTISYILCFITAIVMIIAIFTGIAINTFLNKEYILKSIEKNNYYNKLAKTIQDEISKYSMQSGINEEIFENICTEEQVKKDFNKVISNVYENKKEEIDTSSLKSELEEKIQNYLDENKIPLSKEQNQNVQDLINLIGETYEQGITHSIYLETVQKVISKALAITQYQIYIYIILAVLIILQVLIDRNKMVFRHIGISLLTVGMFIVILLCIFKLNIKLENIVILNNDFSNIIISIAKTIINKILLIGVLNIIISIVMIGIIEKEQNSRRKHGRRIES